MSETKHAALEKALQSAAEAQQDALDALHEALDVLRTLSEKETLKPSAADAPEETPLVGLKTEYELDREDRLTRLRDELKELERRSRDASLTLNERAQLTDQKAYKAQMIQSLEDENEGTASTLD